MGAGALGTDDITLRPLQLQTAGLGQNHGIKTKEHMQQALCAHRRPCAAMTASYAETVTVEDACGHKYNSPPHRSTHHTAQHALHRTACTAPHSMHVTVSS